MHFLVAKIKWVFSKRLFGIMYHEWLGSPRPSPLAGGEKPCAPVPAARASHFPAQPHTSKAGLVLTYSASSMATGHLYWAVLKRQMSAYWRTGRKRETRWCEPGLPLPGIQAPSTWGCSSLECTRGSCKRPPRLHPKHSPKTPFPPIIKTLPWGQLC